MDFFLKKWYSIDISQLPNVSVLHRIFFKKMILKVTRKDFDLLKPKSYLSTLEFIARHAA